MNRHEWAFRRLIRLYPASYREQYEDQMTGLFMDQLRDTQVAGSTVAVARLWADTLIDLVATAPQQHLRKESVVLQPVDPTHVRTTEVRSPMQRVAVVVASVPVILLAALLGFAPGYMDPVFANPPALVGLPMGVVVVAFAAGMAVFGWLIARRAQSAGVALGALAFLTIPSLLLIVMTPALILFLLDMA